MHPRQRAPRLTAARCAHVAPLGMRFYRSSKVGYRVVRVVLDAQGKVLGQE
jgi:hypothetical protein